MPKFYNLGEGHLEPLNSLNKNENQVRQVRSKIQDLSGVSKHSLLQHIKLNVQTSAWFMACMCC